MTLSEMLRVEGVAGPLSSPLAPPSATADSSVLPLPTRIAVIGNYLPRQCGIATFTTDLCTSIASEYGYISAFDLSLGRTYTSHGEKLSYASAACPAPKGFPGASFPFAKTSYEFTGGATLSSTLVRQCKVRGK